MTVYLRFAFAPRRLAALLCAGGVFVAATFAASAQSTGKNQDEGKLPPGSKPAQTLDLDANGQLKKAPDIAKKAERDRLALRALLRRSPGQHVPDNADERDQLLNLLYGHLSKARTEAAAKRITAAIGRVWMHSGSDTVSMLMRRALRADKNKQPDKALKYLGYIVKLAPDFAEGWNQRAYVYFKQKNYAHAMGDLRRVLALDPNHYRALEGLGQILREIDEKRAALLVFRKLVKVYPLLKGAKDTKAKLSRELLGQKS